MVAAALCAWADKVVATIAAATASERHVELILVIIVLGVLVFMGVITKPVSGISQTRKNTGYIFGIVYWLTRRKNCCVPEMLFVTVFCPLTTTGALETVVQTVGAARLVVNCKVKLGMLVGHAKTIAFDTPAPPAGLRLTASVGAGAVVSVGEKTAVLSPAAS